MSLKLSRRSFLAAGAATLAAPTLARPGLATAAPSVLKLIPETDLSLFDPVWTTATNARNHGYLVFDTLWGQDDDNVMQPQMVAGHVLENDGKQWTITLRDGLKFHDGEPVRAQDVVPSIRRFCARDAFGQALMETTDELSVVDDKTFRFRLKRPFPLLPNALGKPGTPMPCIMPERLALTSPTKQVTEMVGSGPFRFLKDEFVSGSRAVYAKFDGYVPCPHGKASFTAGPKVAHFERVEWTSIPDAQTAANALIQGEADWWQTPTGDLMPLLSANSKIETKVLDQAGGIGVLRFNFLFPPFDNPAIRRALLGAVDQSEFMIASQGEDPRYWKDKVGVFSPASPMATDVGIGVLTGKRDLEKVKREIAAAGYKGEKVVILGTSDYPYMNAMALVAADMLQKVGMNVDFQAEDWGTTVQRRTSRKSPEEGGWSIFVTYLNGTNNYDPAGQLGIRGNGDKAWSGWPDMPKLEELRQAWFEAPDLAAQRKICEQIQQDVWQEVPYIPLGCAYFPVAYRKGLVGMRSGFVQFYDVRWA